MCFECFLFLCIVLQGVTCGKGAPKELDQLHFVTRANVHRLHSIRVEVIWEEKKTPTGFFLEMSAVAAKGI
jgi:hypothetical protein